VKKYVNACFACHRIKTIKHKFFEQLQSNFMFKKSRLKWIMNFITDLSFNTNRKIAYDSILVLVNRYTKYARYVRARQNWIAVQLVDAMIKKIIHQIWNFWNHYNWSRKSFFFQSIDERFIIIWNLRFVITSLFIHKQMIKQSVKIKRLNNIFAITSIINKTTEQIDTHSLNMCTITIIMTA
jgi:hypothetical protein